MENYDAQMAARVWERVRGTPQEVPPAAPLREEDTIAALIAGELAAAAVYARLAQGRDGWEGTLLRRLAGEERAHAACLKGVYRLITGRSAAVQAPPPAREAKEAALRRSYTRTLQALREYGARCASGEFGPAFTILAQQERAHCASLLELLGQG